MTPTFLGTPRSGSRPRLLRHALGDLRRDLGRHELVNGVVGLLFSVTGPVAVILAVGRSAGLTQAQVASWVFGVFVLNGLLTIVFSLVHRQPLCFFWTIPGTVVVGQAMSAGMPWAEVVGAYVLAGVLMLLVGLTGQVDRVMELLPMPVVMAMVAGVFLQFGLDLVLAVESDTVLAAPMVLAYVACVALPRLGHWVPPILGALLAGVGAVLLTGRIDASATSGHWLAAPVWQQPVLTWSSVPELVVPLVITVLAVQNGQGMAVLRAAGHQAPMGRVTLGCGVVSVAAAFVGAVSTCLTGPTNALLTTSGERARHYAAAVWCGVLAIAFGLLAPGMVGLILAMPPAFVAALGGLAMLRALQGAFGTAFSGAFATGALVTFLVTVADVTVLNIGAAFWGLVAGLTISALLDPRPRPAPQRSRARPQARREPAADPSSPEGSAAGPGLRQARR